MKTKRAGYLQTGNQVVKRLRRNMQQEQVNTAELLEEKKEQTECEGVCAVSWKPTVVAAR